MPRKRQSRSYFGLIRTNASTDICLADEVITDSILAILGHSPHKLLSSLENSVGHYPNTALFNPPPKKTLSGEWPKLFREINSEKTRFDGGGGE